MSRFLDRLQFQVEPTFKTAVKLTKLLRYMDSRHRILTVPQGFVCDLSSVPRWARSVTTPWNQSARAGVLHDCCYRWGPEVWRMNRSEADEMYRRALIDDGVRPWRAWVQKRAVRFGARRAWKNYRWMPKQDKGVKPKRVLRAI